MTLSHLRRTEAIDPAEQGLDRGCDDIAVDPDAVAFAALSAGYFHEGAGPGISILAHRHHRALLVTAYLDGDPGALQGMDRGVDRAVALAGEKVWHTVDVDVQANALVTALLEQVMLAVVDGRTGVEVGFGEHRPYALCTHFAAVGIGVLLDDAGELSGNRSQFTKSLVRTIPALAIAILVSPAGAFGSLRSVQKIP